MTSLIGGYKALLFDCDGVVLNSNRIKTQAFYASALAYGEDEANALVEYHITRGGISRYEKFTYFLQHIVPDGKSGPDLNNLLSKYAENVRNGLSNCEVATGLHELRERTPDSRWFIISGGDQTELREVFARRGLADYFDGGIFGSPDSKEQIITREKSQGNIQMPALFLGDTRYDYHVATTAGLHFLFISGWSEVEDWQEWTNAHRISVKHSLHDLLA